MPAAASGAVARDAARRSGRADRGPGRLAGAQRAGRPARRRATRQRRLPARGRARRQYHRLRHPRRPRRRRASGGRCARATGWSTSPPAQVVLDATAGSDAGIDVVSSRICDRRRRADRARAAVDGGRRPDRRAARALRGAHGARRRDEGRQGRASARALDQPDPAIRFYLFHGPDEAGSRALGERLLQGAGRRAASSCSAARSRPTRRCSPTRPGRSRCSAARARSGSSPPATRSSTASRPCSRRRRRKPGGRASPARCARRRRCSSWPKAIAPRWRIASYVPEGRDAERMVIDLGRDVGLADADRRRRARSPPPPATTRRSSRRSSKVRLLPRRLARRPRASSITTTLDALGADAARATCLRLGDLALAGGSASLLDELGAAAARAAARRSRRPRAPAAAADARPAARPGRARRTVDAVMTSMGKSLFWKDKATGPGDAVAAGLPSAWRQAAERVGALERQLIFSPAPDRKPTLAKKLVTLARRAAPLSRRRRLRARLDRLAGQAAGRSCRAGRGWYSAA